MTRTSILHLVTLLLPITAHAVKSFPTAEGFGANSVGGRGGRVIEVTTLNDSGAGSLRACVEATGPRTCVFRVAGNIMLQSDLVARAANSYLTIAGQTAPGDGVQLMNYDVGVASAAHDVIIRHLRIRRGTGILTPTYNANLCNGLLIYGSNGERVYNIMIDHVDSYWSCDDSSGAWGFVTDTTIQWSLIAEGLTSKDFAVDNGANSKGMLIGGSPTGKWNDPKSPILTAHHNLFAHAGSRLPNITTANLVDYRNNLVYDWSACWPSNFGHATPADGIDYFTARVNLVNNRWIPGPDGACPVLGEIGGNGTKLFMQGNWNVNCPSGCSNDWDLGLTDSLSLSQGGEARASESQFRVYTPFAAPPVTTTPTANLESVLLAGVGVTRPVRDALDTKVLNDVKNRTGHVGRNGDPAPLLRSATPPVDSDHDGMPDSWESAHGLNPGNPADGAGMASNGYTHLENYLNFMAGDPVDGTVVSLPAAPTALSVR